MPPVLLTCESSTFDRVFFGHRHRQVAAVEVEVLRLIAVMVGKGVRDDQHAHPAQQGKKPFGVADAGHGVDAQVAELVFNPLAFTDFKKLFTKFKLNNI